METYTYFKYFLFNLVPPEVKTIVGDIKIDK